MAIRNTAERGEDDCSGSHSAVLPRFSERTRDQDAYEKVKAIVSSAASPAIALNQILCVLQNNGSTAQILNKYVRELSAPASIATRKNNRVLCAGIPAKYLTIKELVDARKKRDLNSGIRKERKGKTKISKPVAVPQETLNSAIAVNKEVHSNRFQSALHCNKALGNGNGGQDDVVNLVQGLSEHESAALDALRDLSDGSPN
ncbi:hypothetical protein FGB62_92g10 [Gracilaria domingensis]|nr:hypothetical protein FGB62_92g10 [Gracilaria domingensis]